jgi:hypothetical protein
MEPGTEINAIIRHGTFFGVCGHSGHAGFYMAILKIHVKKGSHS